MIGMYAFVIVVGDAIDRIGRTPSLAGGLLVMAVSVISLLWIKAWWARRSRCSRLGLGWNFSFVAATAELADSTQPWERGRLLGFNDLLAGMTGAGSLSRRPGARPDRRGRPRDRCAVLVTFPAAWILQAGGRPPQQAGSEPPTTAGPDHERPGSGQRRQALALQRGAARRLVLSAGGGAAAVAVVGLVLAIVGVVGIWLAGARDRDRRGLWLVAPPHGEPSRDHPAGREPPAARAPAQPTGRIHRMTDLAAKAAELRASTCPATRSTLVNVWDVASAHGRRRAELPSDRHRQLGDRCAHGVRGRPAHPVRVDAGGGRADPPRRWSSPSRPTSNPATARPRRMWPRRWRGRSRRCSGREPRGPPAPGPEHAAVVKAVRERAEREGVPFVINARGDEYLLGERRLDAAIERRAYLDAGADCIFVPGIHELDEIDAAAQARRPGRPCSPHRRAAAARARRGGRGEGQLRTRRSRRGQRRAHRGSRAAAGAGGLPGRLGHRPPAG